MLDVSNKFLDFTADEMSKQSSSNLKNLGKKEEPRKGKSKFEEVLGSSPKKESVPQNKTQFQTTRIENKNNREVTSEKNENFSTHKQVHAESRDSLAGPVTREPREASPAAPNGSYLAKPNKNILDFAQGIRGFKEQEMMPLLDFLSLEKVAMSEQDFTKMISGSSFIQKALSGDIEELMHQEMDINDLVQGLGLDIHSNLNLQNFAINPEEKITPTQLFKSLGIDPGKVVAALSRLKENLLNHSFNDFVKSKVGLNTAAQDIQGNQLKQGSQNVNRSVPEQNLNSVNPILAGQMSQQGPNLKEIETGFAQKGNAAFPVNEKTAEDNQSDNLRIHDLTQQITGLQNKTSVPMQVSSVAEQEKSDNILLESPFNELEIIWEKSARNSEKVNDINQNISTTEMSVGSIEGATNEKDIGIVANNNQLLAQMQGQEKLAGSNILPSEQSEFSLQSLIARAGVPQSQSIKGSQDIEVNEIEASKVASGQNNNLIKTKLGQQNLGLGSRQIQEKEMHLFGEIATLMREENDLERSSEDRDFAHKDRFERINQQDHNFKAEQDAGLMIQDSGDFDLRNTSSAKIDLTKTGTLKELNQDSGSIEIYNRIMDRAQFLSAQGGGKAQLNLKDNNLGDLSIYINLEGNDLSLKLKTQSEQFKNIIGQELHLLKDSLAHQNINLVDVNVDLSNEQKPFFEQNDFYQQQQNQQFEDRDGNEFSSSFSDFAQENAKPAYQDRLRMKNMIPSFSQNSQYIQTAV